MPAEPEYVGDTIQAHFYGFGDRNVPGFIFADGCYHDTIHPDTLSILLLGDVHNQLTHADWIALSARHRGIDAYAQLGDFVDRPYFYHEQTLLHDLQGTYFDSIPLLAVPGNHEYIKGIFPTLPDRWTELFHNPNNGPKGFVGRTYFVDFPAYRFIGIDTNGLNHLYDYLRLRKWLKSVMKPNNEDSGNTRNGWGITCSERAVIVMMHHPVYSCAKGRQNLLIRLFLKGVLDKADLVVAGHDHGYCRRLPYLDTNSAKKHYHAKTIDGADLQIQDKQLYEVIGCATGTIRVQTREISTGELIDEFVVSD